MSVLKEVNTQSDPAYRPRYESPTTRLKVHCGCGVSFDNVVEGEMHAHKEGHTLHVTGEIRIKK